MITKNSLTAFVYWKKRKILAKYFYILCNIVLHRIRVTYIYLFIVTFKKMITVKLFHCK